MFILLITAAGTKIRCCFSGEVGDLKVVISEFGNHPRCYGQLTSLIPVKCIDFLRQIKRALVFLSASPVIRLDHLVDEYEGRAGREGGDHGGGGKAEK